MDSTRWQRVALIFDAVVEVAGAQRARLLDELCAGDEALCAEVEALLAADAASHGFDAGVDSARVLAAAEWAGGEETTVGVGERIGPWRVERELGRGGMGVVLLVTRADGQFEQRAALKLIKRGMDSDAVQARFRRERQILARLQHPFIARLLDGGLSATGRPYFAMEYVDGAPLLRYCEQHALGLEPRLALFLDLCAAVQFAHAQLIVHRDIKPSNVLVTAQGRAMLLDFGIAKLLDPGESGAGQSGAGETADAAHRPLTFAYAAPEQWRGEPVGIATDVYALGGVLYEMLAGRRAFALADTPSLAQMQRVLDATAPPPPSVHADARSPVPPQRLRGDLDLIVQTAMKREPQRRYATVDALAADLRQYLAGRPIAARRDSARYRLRKFVARHTTAVLLGGVGIVALVAVLALAVWQAREKTREARASQAVTAFLTGLFAGADPTHAGGVVVSAQDLLDQGARRLQSQLDDAPALRARLLSTVGNSYIALGLYDRALPLAQQALALRRQLLRADDPELAESLDQLGRIQTERAEYDQAEPLLRQALASRRQALGEDDPSSIDSAGNLAVLLQNRGEFQAADAVFAAALQSAQRRYGMDAVETARRLDDAATNLDNLGRKADAQAAYQRALAIRERRLGPDDPEVATSLHNLGLHLDNAGESAQAEPLLLRALAIRRRVFGAGHVLVGFTELALGGVYQGLERLDEAEQVTHDALEIFRRTLDPGHRRISESLNQLAILRTAARDFAAAVPLSREVFERFRSSLGADHPDTLAAQNNLMFALMHTGALDEAEQLGREVLVRARADNGQGLLTLVNENLAGALQQQGRATEALTYAREAAQMQRKLEGERSPNIAVAVRLQALAEALAGDAVAAEKHFREALSMGQQLGTALYPARTALADFLVGQKRCVEARPLLDAALDELAQAHGGGGPVWEPEAQLLRAYCQAGATPGALRAAAVYDRLAALGRITAIDADLYPTTRQLRHTR